jgi:hypothetical protein
MAHSVSGFDLDYTSRTSWKANVRSGGRIIAVAPVTWTKGRREGDDGTVYQEVWFQHAAEMEERRLGTEPFIVAVAVAKDYNHPPHQFYEFRSVLEVVSTGRVLTDKSIETRVLRRVRSVDFENASRS